MISLKQTIMERDGLSSTEAVDDLRERLAVGEDADDICEEYFGLEPDFIMDLINEL